MFILVNNIYTYITSVQKNIINKIYKYIFKNYTIYFNHLYWSKEKVWNSFWDFW